MILATLLALPVLLPASGGDDHWPGFRGDGSGIAKGKPPVEWSEEKNVRWKTEIPGKGSSSPVVWGDLVFVTTAIPTGKAAEKPQEPEGGDEGEGQGGGGRGRRGGGRFRGEAPVEQEFAVLALDRKEGAIVWQKTASKGTPPQGTHPTGSYASPTIVTDGKLVIASFGSNGIYAFDIDGELVWKKDLGDMQIMMSFGEGSSPVLAGDKLVVVWDNEGDSFIAALDKKTGKELWRTPRDLGTTWVTPLVVEAEGGPQVVVAAAKTIAYSLDSGKEIWSYTMPIQMGGRGGGRGRRGGQDGGGERDGRQGIAPPQGQRPGRGGGGERRGPRAGGGVISSGVAYDGILLYSSGNRGGSLCALKLADLKGEVDKGEAVLWEAAGDTPHVPSPIAYDGILYSLKQNDGMLSAYDILSGERLYGPERMKGVANAYASPVVAGDHLYVVGRDGTSEVVALGPEFKSVAVNVLDDNFDASPAVAGDQLFLRGLHHVYCIAKRD